MMAKDMLTRLTDRIEKDENGEDLTIKRYGMWGTTKEIERIARNKYKIVPGSDEGCYKTLEEAANELRLIAGR